MIYYIERENQFFVDFGELNGRKGRILLMPSNTKERPTGLLLARHKDFDETVYSEHLQDNAVVFIGFNTPNDVIAMLIPLVKFIEELSKTNEENGVKERYEEVNKKLIALIGKANNIDIKFPNTKKC